MSGPWSLLLSPLKDALKAGVTDAVRKRLIDKVLGIHDEQLEAQLRVERNLDDLLAGPFHAGIDWLESARAPNRTAKERREYTERALEKFVDAQAQLRGHGKAVAQVYAAVAHALLGHGSDFERWLGRARDTADATIAEALERAKARNRLLTGLFGRDRRASHAFLAELGPNHAVIAAINATLDPGSAVEWSYEILRWEEDVAKIEPLDSGVAQRSSLHVQRGDEVTILADPYG